jgi:hypothetical protein
LEKNLSADLKKKYNRIYNHERAVANLVALRVVESKPIGVWEFLIPVVFILHFMRNKQSREVFIQNYLFTKRHALDAAFKMRKKGHGLKEAITEIENKTRKLLTAQETRGIYSETIRRQQMGEIKLLVDHYSKLLDAGGEDYAALARNAYGSRKNYNLFHENLKSVEKAVSDAAQQTLGIKADNEALSRIEKATEAVRQSEIEKIFGRDTENARH